MQKLVVVSLCAAMVAGCGAYRIPAVAPTSGWPVAPESRVKILWSGVGNKEQIGIALSSTHDTLFFRQDMQTNIRPVSVRDIRRLEIAQGTHTQKRKSAMIGGAIGLVAGGVLGAATATTPPSCPPNTLCLGFDSVGRVGRALIGALLGAVTGEIIGVLAGAQATDTWVPVNVPTSP